MLTAVDDADVAEVWGQLREDDGALAKACEEIAVTNDLLEPPTQRAMYRRLLSMGLVRGRDTRKVSKEAAKPRAKRRCRGASAPSVDAAMLRDLYEEHKDAPDALNQITARLPHGPWSAQQDMWPH
eukprot:361935-Chlamydomonas_euryale.AAC.9